MQVVVLASIGLKNHYTKFNYCKEQNANHATNKDKDSLHDLYLAFVLKNIYSSKDLSTLFRYKLQMVTAKQQISQA